MNTDSINEQFSFGEKRRSYFFRWIEIWVVCLGVLLSQACGLPDFASEYAVATVRLPNGRDLYFKREVRGINGSYDVIAISANGDPCVSQDDKTDYCICSYTRYVYYKIDADTLHLYGSTANRVPKEFPFSLKVENHEINPMDWEKFEQDYVKQGITRLDLEKALGKCNR